MWGRHRGKGEIFEKLEQVGNGVDKGSDVTSSIVSGVSNPNPTEITNTVIKVASKMPLPDPAKDTLNFVSEGVSLVSKSRDLYQKSTTSNDDSKM